MVERQQSKQIVVPERAGLMENYFDTASAVVEVVTVLWEEHDVHKLELVQRAMDLRRKVLPGFVCTFAEECFDLSEQKKNILRAVSRLATEEYIDYGSALFRSLFTGYRRENPVGTVSEVSTSFPLAIGMKADMAVDYQKLETRPSGGFYSKERCIHLYDGSIVRYPVMVTFGPYNGHALGHEQGHAIAEVVEKSCLLGEGLGWSSMFGKYAGIDASSLRRNARELERTWREDDHIGTREWSVILEYAWTRAKHEILAEMYNPVGDVKQHLEALKDPNGLYNYFDLYCDMDASGEFFESIWEAYTKVLGHEVSVALGIYDVYRSHGMKRAPLFPWVLAQIPLSEWEYVLSYIGIQQEAEYLMSVPRRYISREVRENMGEPVYAYIQSMVNCGIVSSDRR